MVRQFSINLNRQEGYAQREERKRKLRERITLVVTTLFLLLMAFFNYQSDREMRSIISAKQKQLRRIIAQIDSLQKEGRNVSKEDVLALARMDQERVFWTKKLRALTERMPDKMAIAGLKLERGKFVIEAISQIHKNEKEFDKVKLFMDRLRATPLFFEDFRNIKFTESRREKRDDQEILSFVITSEVDQVRESRISRRAGSRKASPASIKKGG